MRRPHHFFQTRRRLLIACAVGCARNEPIPLVKGFQVGDCKISVIAPRESERDQFLENSTETLTCQRRVSLSASETQEVTTDTSSQDKHSTTTTPQAAKKTRRFLHRLNPLVEQARSKISRIWNDFFVVNEEVRKPVIRKGSSQLFVT